MTPDRTPRNDRNEQHDRNDRHEPKGRYDKKGRTSSRRSFLKVAGIGLGTIAIAGAAGLTWRAVDGGVFASGTGEAFAAWAQAGPEAHDALGLVRAAVLAANAHNAQPWQFRVADNRIDVFADTTRNLGTMDPLLREMDVSLGCAIENIVVAAPANGKKAAVTLLPDPADPTHVARIDLQAAEASVSPLFTAIASRHTDRNSYDLTRPVSAAELARLSGLIDETVAELVWFSDPAEKNAFGALTVRATEAIIADPQQVADDAAWYRTDWHEIQSKKDGITIDPSGQSEFIRAVSKVIPVSTAQNNAGWLAGTRDSQVPTAAAFGALVVRDPLDTGERLAVGRAWQRLHLSMTVDGVSAQPLCQVPERIDRERSTGLNPDFGDALAALLPAGRHAIMTFRIGHPTGSALPSPRRPAREVVLS
ncbi:hypothetical protein E3O55_13820 [Cryobacterium sp. MDB1-18-2]|uniref:Acg family FMN-binding oxidoreductase n=1 Tax=unclassified Cryobacterium TaxID=2649013 RepID=UPI00106C52F3|nr:MULTISPECIES: hypothetical protein [unclassified Cryobacterium]TFC25838.1 hypothetical protein E3O55_13820 [Cryobacterium sp. MDB1-18-2]TFC45669.1 hypothetical protein E3O50_02735 [Cryobacterium sp. MDB1-18-1]